jgi:ribosomal protein S3AE
VVKDKEGKGVKLKLLITTRMKVAIRTKADIRKEVRDFVTEYVGKMNRDEFLKALVASDLQAEGMKKLEKIAPVAKIEIKKIEF